MLRHLETSNRKLQSRYKEKKWYHQRPVTAVVWRKCHPVGPLVTEGCTHSQDHDPKWEGKGEERTQPCSPHPPPRLVLLSYWKNLIRAMWQVTRSTGLSHTGKWRGSEEWIKIRKGELRRWGSKKNLSVEVASQIRLREKVPTMQRAIGRVIQQKEEWTHSFAISPSLHPRLSVDPSSGAYQTQAQTIQTSIFLSMRPLFNILCII